MSISVHQRPGVYSSYGASTVVSGSGSGRVVGLAAISSAKPEGTRSEERRVGKECRL